MLTHPHRHLPNVGGHVIQVIDHHRVSQQAGKRAGGRGAAFSEQVYIVAKRIAVWVGGPPFQGQRTGYVYRARHRRYGGGWGRGPVLRFVLYQQNRHLRDQLYIGLYRRYFSAVRLFGDRDGVAPGEYTVEPEVTR